MKYLILQLDGALPAPILFPDHILHSDVAEALGARPLTPNQHLQRPTVLSAGLVAVFPVCPAAGFSPRFTVQTFGASVGLNQSPRAPEDAALIRALLQSTPTMNWYVTPLGAQLSPSPLALA